MNEAFEYDLICLGSGPAGQRAAVQAAKLDKKVALVEKGQGLGGVCVNTGTIPSKTLRQAIISTCGDSSSFSTEHWSEARAQPSLSQLLEGVNAIMAAEARVQSDQLRRNDIDLLLGHARFEDAHTVAVRSANGVRKITASKIIIATGTRPRMPRDFGFDGLHVISSDEIMKLRAVPDALVVIGCGVIGIEYASMFAALGTEVTVVDGKNRVLDFLDHDLVDELLHELRNRNVTFRLGDAVDKIEVNKRPRSPVSVTLHSKKRIRTDLVLVCAGRQGASGDLGLNAAGLTADDRGRIKVDAELRTAQPDIFAAGDIIGFPSLAATSSEQGRRAACNAFGHEVGPMSRHYPIGIYAIPEMSMVGRPEHELTKDKIPYEYGIAHYREIAWGQIRGEQDGLLKLLFHQDDHKLLGVHAIGTGATELVHIGQAVIAHGAGIQYFLDAVFNYPTLAECYKVAALDAYNKLAL